jgi:hypothetical protein
MTYRHALCCLHRAIEATDVPGATDEVKLHNLRVMLSWLVEEIVGGWGGAPLTADLASRVAELERQVASMRRDEVRACDCAVAPFDQLTGEPLSEGAIAAARQLAEVRRGTGR